VRQKNPETELQAVGHRKNDQGYGDDDPSVEKFAWHSVPSFVCPEHYYTVNLGIDMKPFGFI
jgi:hypothetical protein